MCDYGGEDGGWVKSEGRPSPPTCIYIYNPPSHIHTYTHDPPHSAGDVDIYEQTHESLKALLADIAEKEMGALRGANNSGSRKRPASALAGGGGGGAGGVKWEYRGPDGQVCVYVG